MEFTEEEVKFIEICFEYYIQEMMWIISHDDYMDTRWYMQKILNKIYKQSVKFKKEVNK